jgi:Core-2/I-Branching enzyme
MKLAFCFLTRSNLNQPIAWNRFFSNADPEQYKIYSHAKYPAAVSDDILTSNQIVETIPTKPGHVSIVLATAKLFEAALEDDEENTYFILLSESAIPIKPFASVIQELTRAGRRSVIPFSVPALGSEHQLRLNAVVDPQVFAAEWFHHGQWIVLHRSHVDALLRTPRYAMFERVFAADEHYFMNVLIHVCGVPLVEILNKATTYNNWREREVVRHSEPRDGMIQTVHPKTYNSLSPQDIVEAENKGCWFFRKVSASCDCRLVLDRITSPGN